MSTQKVLSVAAASAISGGGPESVSSFRGSPKACVPVLSGTDGDLIQSVVRSGHKPPQDRHKEHLCIY